MNQKIIGTPTDIPLAVYKYICERWSKHLEPFKGKFIEVGLAGRSVTETSPDMPWGRTNYSCSEDGIWTFDWAPKEDTGDIVISYATWADGYRSVADNNYDYMKKFEEGVFKIERGEEDAMKMAALVPEMSAAFIMAIEDAEKKFNIRLPKY